MGKAMVDAGRWTTDQLKKWNEAYGRGRSGLRPISTDHCQDLYEHLCEGAPPPPHPCKAFGQMNLRELQVAKTYYDWYIVQGRPKINAELYKLLEKNLRLAKVDDESLQRVLRKGLNR